DIDLVALLSRRGVRRGVQRVEVVVDEVDLGPVDDDVAEADEDVQDVAPGLLDQVRVAPRVADAGQLGSAAVVAEPLLELLAAQLARTALDEALQRPPGPVQLVAARPALLRR